MAKRKIHFDIGKAVREFARDIVGQPPRTKVRTDKRLKKEKHKPPYRSYWEEQE